MNIYAIIPAYNSSATIEQVIRDTRQQLSEKAIIVVDDGSSDNTAGLSRQLGVLVLAHSKNQGKGAALKTGFSKALECGAELVFTLDADGQHPPRAFVDFLKKMTETGADVVLGKRLFDPRKMPFHRILSNRMTSFLLSWRVGCQIDDSQCGYRLLRASVLKSIQLDANRFDLESELLIKAGLAGFRFASVPIETIYQNQSSSIHLLWDTVRFIKLYFKSWCWK